MKNTIRSMLVTASALLVVAACTDPTVSPKSTVSSANIFSEESSYKSFLAKIYGVITFYHYFKLKKPGRNQIAVCMGTACYLKGAGALLEELNSLLGVPANEVTPDGEFSFEAVRCVGCCGLAPVLTVNGEVYGKALPAQLPDIIAKYQGK